MARPVTGGSDGRGTAVASRRQALPGPLPAGEALLWQGAPRWGALARRAFHTRGVAAYFGLLMAWSAATTLSDGGTAAEAVVAAAWGLPPALAALGVLSLLAWLSVRSTAYAITTRRVVMRIGVAIPVTVNLPFRVIGSAGVRVHADGTADIPLALVGDGRMGYVHLWPHARAWRVSRPEPMLRAVPDGARVAEILARALLAASAPAAASAAAPAAAPVARPAVEGATADLAPARPVAAAA